MPVRRDQVIGIPLAGAFQKFVILGVLLNRENPSSWPDQISVPEEFPNPLQKSFPSLHVFQNQLRFPPKSRGDHQLVLALDATIYDPRRSAPAVETRGD